MIANLRKAVFDQETIDIGGGRFCPAELKEAADKLQQYDALIAAITGLLECTELNMDDMEADTIYMIENARMVLADTEVPA